MKPQNPFVVSGYVSPEFFCNRQKETKKIISAIISHRNITLFSIRRIGKTGLIDHTFYHLSRQKNIVHIYFDILSTQNIQEFINIFANAVLSKLESKPEKLIKKISELFGSLRSTITFDPTTNLPNISFDVKSEKESAKTIEQIFAFLGRQKKKIIIAIDEFQQIVNYPEKNVEAIMRTNIQRLRNTNFIFSGSQKHLLISMFSQYGKPFYQSAEMMSLDKLAFDDYFNFIKNNFHKRNVEIDNEQVSRILEWTRSHTYYTQFLCNRLWGTGAKKITHEIVTSTMHEILNENEAVYVNYRNLLTDYQWKILKAVAKEGCMKLILSKDFIMKHKLHTPSSVQTAFKALLEKEMIYKENEFYFVYDVFLERWLELH